MSPSPQWTPADGLASYAVILARKVGIIAALWVPLYFLTQWCNTGSTMLFAPLIGGIAGLAIGWYLAEDAVEDAGFGGIGLYIILSLAVWIPPWIVELILNKIMSLAGWKMDFGRYMLMTAMMLLGFATAVYRASADD